VNERAEMWDKSVSWVMEKLKFYLCVGQPGVAYHFSKTREIHRKVLHYFECFAFDIAADFLIAHYVND